jgi:hypothetical protein
MTIDEVIGLFILVLFGLWAVVMGWRVAVWNIWRERNK